MKILILSDANSVHTYRWAKSLKSKGLNIEIFSLYQYEKEFSPSYKSLGINVTTSNVNRFILYKYRRNITKISYLFALRTLKKCIKRFNPQLIHAHYLTSYGILARLSGFRPYCISIWGDDVFLSTKNFIMKNLLYFSLKNAQQLFSTSHAINDLILNQYNLSTKIIPFGVDTKIFTPLDRIKTGPVIIGIIKSIESHNGIEFLVDAFNILKKKNINNIELNIVGTGPLEKKIKKKVKQFKLETKVHFLGHIPHQKIVPQYQKLSIFVCPSIRESFGVSVIEASACALPIIANKVGGLMEVIQHGRTGYLLDATKPKKLADCLEKLIIDPKLRFSLGQNGRDFVKNNFDWETNVIEMVNVYKKINKSF